MEFIDSIFSNATDEELETVKNGLETLDSLLASKIKLTGKERNE